MKLVSEFLCFLLIINKARRAFSDERPTVTIQQGTLRGIIEKSTKGKDFYSFMNIPFAEPPIGKLRFKDPVPSKPWKGILEANKDPDYCIQITVMDSYLTTDPVPEGTEDCLYLSVYSPSLKKNAELPVMVYFHGGAFIRGGTKDYKPYSLLNEDIVLVVPQNRLSLFGYLAIENSPINGNYGLKDGILALKWVQENIREFGGDPGRVTIFGHSSGGIYSNLMVFSPEAKGLFHGAILHSGFAFMENFLKGSDQAKVDDFLQKVDCKSTENYEKFLECLQNVDTETIFKTFSKTMEGDMLQVAPIIDGDILPDRPINIVKGKLHNSVNLMAGMARDDGGFHSLLMKPPVGICEGTLQAMMHIMMMFEGLSKENSQRVFDNYFSKDCSWNEWNQFFTDYSYEVSLNLLSNLETNSNFKTYFYQLDHRGQFSYADFIQVDLEEKKHWVIHGDDLFYLFAGGPIYTKPLEREEDLKLRDIYLKLWSNFAKTGNPTPDQSLGFKWEPASPNNTRRLSINPKPYMKGDRPEVRDFWFSLPIDGFNLYSNPTEKLEKSAQHSKEEL